MLLLRGYLLSILLFTSCAVDNKKPIQDNNQEVKKYYYPNGQLKSTGSLKNGKKNGKAQLYYENGKLKEEGNWVDDKQEGLWLFYNEEGGIIGKVNFKNNLQDGLTELYYNNGVKEQEMRLINGVYHGVGKFYYRNGKLKQTTEWSFGKRDGTTIKYDSLGEGYKKLVFRNDTLVGE